MEIFLVLYRTVFFYFFITIIYRFMGKREIGQLGIVDLIVSILIAELAAISIDNEKENLLMSVIPIIVLLGIQIGMSYISLRSSKIRNVFDGKPSVMINHGVVNFKEMVKQRYNIDDLLTQLREKQIRTLEEVDYAVLETSGKLSVFKKKGEKFGNYPMPLILDGKIQENTLKHIDKSSNWINKILKKQNLILEDIFYAFYKNDELYIIKQDEVKK